MARGHGDQVDTNFTRGAPYKIWEGNACPKFSAIFDYFWLWSRTSPERIDKSKIGKVLDQLHFIPDWAKKFGELWSTNNKVIDAHVDPPKWTFFGILNFSPQGVLAPENFTRARYWPRLTSAHRKSGKGSPKNFNGEHLKLGLKFHTWAPIILGVVGVTLRNFTRWRVSRPRWSNGH